MPQTRRLAPLSAAKVADPLYRLSACMVETVEKRYRILVSRSPTAPKRYTALPPTRADHVNTMGPLVKLILSVCEVSGCKPGKRAQCE